MRRAGAVLLLLPLLLSGCGAGHLLGAVPMERLELVRALAVDPIPGGVRVTVSTAAGKGERPKLASMEGPTLELALHDLRHSTRGQETYLAHTQYVLVNGAGSSPRLPEVLDFLARSGQVRNGVTLLLVRGGEAGALLRACAGPGTSAPDRLDVLAQSLPRRGDGMITTARDTTAALAAGGAAAVMGVRLAPCDGGEETETDLLPEPAGFALVDRTGVRGWLAGEGAAGAVLLMGAFRSGELTARTPSGLATVCLTRAAVRLYPDRREPDSGVVTVTVRADLRQLTGPGNPMDPAFRAALETAVSDRVAARVRQALAVTRALGLDALGLTDRMERAAGGFSRSPARDGDGAFSRMQFVVSVRTRLVRSFDLAGPLPGAEGEA